MTDATGNDFDAERTQRFDFQVNPQPVAQQPGKPAAQPVAQEATQAFPPVTQSVPQPTQSAQPTQPVQSAAQAPAFNDLLMPAAGNAGNPGAADFQDFQEAPASVAPAGDAVALKKKRPIGLIVTLCIFVALLAAVIGGFFGARAYFSDRVAPGVSFGGVNLTGQNADQVKAVVESKIADSKVTITSTDGKTATASLKDLGVNADADATVNALIDAKPGTDFKADFTRLNPWAKQDVPLTVTTDKQALADYLTSQLVDESQRAVAASVQYNDQSKTYAVVDGREGQTPDPKPVEEAIAVIANEPGTTQRASVDYLSVSMPITAQTAQQAADAANQRLNAKYVINNSQKKSFTVPVEEIAKWIGFESDPEAGTITLTYDDNAVTSYLASVLPDALKQEMVKESIVTNKAGKKMTVLREGKDGVTVTGTDDAASQVAAALKEGTDVTASAKVDVAKFETESRVVDYDSPNGDPHVVINLSEQKVYAYKGTTLVKTFNASTGLNTPGRKTDTGTFFAQSKYDLKTMKACVEGECYETPNVPWTTFYNGGEGLHGAPWNSAGIASGTPKSHGCTNMNVADAKWIYDFLPIGGMVQVVGTTPDTAVRQGS